MEAPELRFRGEGSGTDGSVRVEGGCVAGRGRQAPRRPWGFAMGVSMLGDGAGVSMLGVGLGVYMRGDAVGVYVHGLLCLWKA